MPQACEVASMFPAHNSYSRLHLVNPSHTISKVAQFGLRLTVQVPESLDERREEITVDHYNARLIDLSPG